MTNRLTEKDLKVLKSAGEYVVGETQLWNSPIFGTLSNKDHIELHVFDNSDNLIKSGMVSDFSTNNGITLKPGDDLRRMGFLSGEFKVVYNFFRYTAGYDKSVLVRNVKNHEGEIYTGPSWITGVPEQPYWINGNGKIYIGDKGNTQYVEELELRELKYFIQEISSDKMEIRLMPLDINLDKYKREFAELYTDEKKYTPVHFNGAGKLTFENPGLPTITFNKYSQDAGVNEMMNGGTLTVKNAFVIGETKTYQTTKIFNLNDTTLYKNPDGTEWTGTDETRWDQTLHGDAIRLVDPNHQDIWYGINSWGDNVWSGYHAKIVKNEGFSDSKALKFISQNAQFGLENRSMPIFMFLNSPASKGAKSNDKIKVSFKQKSTIDNRGVHVTFRYDLILEDMPPVPPSNFNRSSNEALGTLSPMGQWIWKRSIPDGNYYTLGDTTGWNPYNYLNPITQFIYHWSYNSEESMPITPPDGFSNTNAASQKSVTSTDGIWVWTEVTEEFSLQPGFKTPLAKMMWVKKEKKGYVSLNLINNITNIKNLWSDVEYVVTLPAGMDMDGEVRLSFYGQYGDEATVWVSDINVEYVFSDSEIIVPTYGDFVSKITGINSNKDFTVEDNWNTQAVQKGHIGGELGSNQFENWNIVYKTGDNANLNTLLNFGDNKLALTVNYKKDDQTVTNYPHSIVYKLYEPLPGDIKKGDLCYVVKEMAPSHEDMVSLIPFVEEKIDATVLRQPNIDFMKSPQKEGETSYTNRDTLLTSNETISTTLENMIISASSTSVNLNVDYSQFDNFIHFGSAARRIKNFKTKLLSIEAAVSASASLASNNNPVTSSLTNQIRGYERIVYKLKNEFDGFESYMYNDSSSFVSNSLGIYYDNSWPKDASSKPYVLSPVTASATATWYNNQIISASSYDIENGNRLINLTPLHISDNAENDDYLNFVDLTGHFFDNIWLYIKNMPSIHDRRDKLSEGLSKDLIYDVAKSLGWEMNNGKSLIDLPKYKLGLENTGSDWTTYSTIAEEDISKEIWNRVINNMPYFLKTKGTERAIRGLINCYGIPSTILKIKEFGGPDIPGTAPSYDLTRRFTKAIDFKGGQYVQTTWVADENSGRKPDTVEFRFKAVSGSDQVLVQSNNHWAITLEDNYSTDNYGFVGFWLSGSNGYLHVSSSQLPVYDGEFYSVMLKRNVVPTVSSTVSESAFSYDDNRLKLTSVSGFSSVGQVTTTNNQGLSVTFRYTSKNNYTNELIGVTGWPKRQRTIRDNSIFTSSISLGTRVSQLQELTDDSNDQDIKYELHVKKYNASTDNISYQSQTSLLVSGSEGAVSESYNAAYSSSANVFIGGEPGNPFGTQFSGSMMEFRYWNSPLETSAFDNHVMAPKAFNGNHASASYTDLVLRYSFDDNINHSTNPSVRDTSADQSYIQNGTATNFANEINYSSVEDVQRMFVPNVSPTRRMSSKVRIETNTIDQNNDGYIVLDPKLRKEKSAYDTAPVDSNKIGIYFAPTDVINEDIILSVADLDFNKYIGDPRDKDKTVYKDLNHIASTYWQKYNSPNNFWDYIRLMKYYDTSLYDQLRRLIPGRSSATIGLVIEPNIFERSKAVISKNIEWNNESYEGIINVAVTNDGTPQISMSADFPYWEGIIGYDSEHSSSFMSDIFRRPTLYNLTGSNYWTNLYATASVDKGGPEFVFAEGLQPYVSHSRLSEHNYIKEYYYSSSYSQSVNNYYSSSLYRARYQGLSYNISMRRLYFEGCTQTKDTTPDSKNPVEVTITSPTELITKEPGESKLAVK